MSKSLLAWMALFLLAAPALAGDWPRFMGADQNNIAKETGLAKSWPAAGPKVLWTVPVGAGYGGATIEKGKVYILDRVSDKQDVLRCLDLANGKEDWNFGFDAIVTWRMGHMGSRNLVTIDQDAVFFCGTGGDLYAIDKQTHKPLWTKSLRKDFGSSPDGWNFSQAPVLYKDTVIFAPVSASAGVVAFNKKTGAIAWKSPALSGKLGHSSPVLTTIGGVDQVIMVTGDGAAGVAAADGKLLWTYFGQWRCNIPIPAAQPVGDGRVIITGEYGAGTAMLKITKTGDAFAAEQLFLTKDCQAQVHQPLIIGNVFYANGNGNSQSKGLLCMDMSGKLLWSTGQKKFGLGALMLADGMIYILEGDRGDLVMVKPNMEKYEEVARANVLSGREIWGEMALSDGKLIVRDQKQMKCLDIKSAQ